MKTEYMPPHRGEISPSKPKEKPSAGAVHTPHSSSGATPPSATGASRVRMSKGFSSAPSDMSAPVSRTAPVSTPASRPAPVSTPASRPAPMSAPASRPAPMSAPASRPTPMSAPVSRPTPMGGAYTPPMARPMEKGLFLIILSDIEKEATVIRLSGKMTVGREVPGNKPDIAIDSPIVSRKHGAFEVRPDGVYYTDEESFNGTFINGRLYKQGITACDIPVRLNDGDVLRFDSQDSSKSHKNSVTIIFSTTYDKRSKWKRIKSVPHGMSLGLSAKNLIEFDRRQMALQCAQITFSGAGLTLSNVSGRNNLLYNNTPVSGSCLVRNRDVFKVDRSFLYYDNGELLYSVCLVTEPGLDVRLAETFVPDKFQKKVLLKDINLNIDKGDFALIIGGSGAGKSTFMNSILGKYDIIGNVSLGGRVATGNSEVTSGIAYVPQTLPLRKEEKLIDVVTDTCVLRCRRAMNKTQRSQFIMETLDSLGLKSKANVEIKKLSGGEQRRAAIANEVVTDADVFFLDEPDSGLDPKSGMELMNNLKALSDAGKMVMLISHNYASYPSPEKIYTKIIILAKSNHDGIGRLAFCGPVGEALEFFGVEALKDITKLINPVSENGEGRADEFVEKFRRLYGRG